MPMQYARNTQQTPRNTQRTTLGYSDQIFNSSKDHLQELEDYTNQMVGATDKAQAPYVSS